MSKNYVGNGRTVSTQYGDMYNISLSADKLKGLANEKGYINLTVSKLKEKDKYGNDLTVYENTYKKEDKNEMPF